MRDDLRVATKFAPYPYRIGSQSIVKACEETLERLEADVSMRSLDQPDNFATDSSDQK